MSKQLDIFEERKKAKYQSHWEKFYARNLKEAEERREASKRPEPVTCISILTGESIEISELIRRNKLTSKSV